MENNKTLVEACVDLHPGVSLRWQRKYLEKYPNVCSKDTSAFLIGKGLDYLNEISIEKEESLKILSNYLKGTVVLESEINERERRVAHKSMRKEFMKIAKRDGSFKPEDFSDLDGE